MRKLRNIRKYLSMTQDEFAHFMGIPLRTLEDIEAGRSKTRQLYIDAALWKIASQHGYHMAIVCEGKSYDD